jgi:hypothetical protein
MAFDPHICMSVAAKEWAISAVCLPKTSSRSTSHRINNIPLDLLWWVAVEDKACNALLHSPEATLEESDGVFGRRTHVSGLYNEVT